MKICSSLDANISGFSHYAANLRILANLAGRSETEVEYDVGFNSKGRISALSVRGWWLAGGDLDLAWNDMMIIQTGADQVRL